MYYADHAGFYGLLVVFLAVGAIGAAYVMEILNKKNQGPANAAARLYKMVREIHREDDKAVAVFIGDGNAQVGQGTMLKLEEILKKAIDSPFPHVITPELMSLCHVDGWYIKDVLYRRSSGRLTRNTAGYYVRFELDRVGKGADIKTETVITPLIPHRCVTTLRAMPVRKSETKWLSKDSGFISFAD